MNLEYEIIFREASASGSTVSLHTRSSTIPPLNEPDGEETASTAVSNDFISASTETRKRRATTFSNTSKMVCIEKESLDLSYMEYRQRDDFLKRTVNFMDNTQQFLVRKDQRQFTQGERIMKKLDTVCSILSGLTSAMDRFANAYTCYVEYKTGRSIRDGGYPFLPSDIEDRDEDDSDQCFYPSRTEEQSRHADNQTNDEDQEEGSS